MVCVYANPGLLQKVLQQLHRIRERGYGYASVIKLNTQEKGENNASIYLHVSWRKELKFY